MEGLAAYLSYTDLLDHSGQETGERIATLVLNRPDVANAFSGELLSQISSLLQAVAQDKSVRLLLLQGSGKHFSAGADLHWMKAAAQLDFAGNLAEAEKLTVMFEALARLGIPTLALSKGAAFGGAVGLLAACDYVIAVEQSKFCLSETKIGLIPAVILPYLARKIQPAALHRLVLTARVVTAEEAQAVGLVQAVVKPSEAEDYLRQELELLLSASPEAQTSYKKLYQDLSTEGWQQGPETAHAIATIRASTLGQQGLQSFFQKSPAPWMRKIPATARLVIP